MDKTAEEKEQSDLITLLKSFESQMFLRLYQPERHQLTEIIDLVIELENKVSSDWYLSIINKEQKGRIEQLEKRNAELKLEIECLERNLRNTHYQIAKSGKF